MANSIYYNKTSKNNQIEKISEEVSKIFIRDSQNNISIDINLLLKQIKEILSQIELISKTIQKKNEEGKVKNKTTYFLKNLKTGNIKKRQLLIKGYIIIMDFLEALTNNTIDYRCYYTSGKNQNKVYVKSFTKEQLLANLIIGKDNQEETGFKLDTSSINNQIKNNKEISNAENIFITHFNNLYNDIMLKDMQPGYTYGYMVHSIIIDTYGSSKDKMPKNLFNKTGRYQQFNKGHIVEGLDISIFEAAKAKSYEELLVFNRERIRELFYTKNLNYDNVKGFKQGDNTFTNTQIKMSNADLMDYKTIYNYLRKIYDSLTKENIDKLKLVNDIKKMFYQVIEEDTDAHITDFINNKLNLDKILTNT